LIENPQVFGGGAKYEIMFVAKVTGIESIQLAVESRNKAAKELSSKFGFKPFGLEKNGLKVGGEYFCEVWMSVDLDRMG
jgi:RimJ/RimL family protein N-acetyltransferase